MPKPAPIHPAPSTPAPQAAAPQPFIAPAAPRQAVPPARPLPVAPEPPPPPPEPQPAARRAKARARTTAQTHTPDARATAQAQAPARRAPIRPEMNALRHGLTSQVLILTAQDEPHYLAHCRDFVKHYQPEGFRELHLTQQLADLQWRLYRVAAQEANLFALAEFDSGSLYQAGRPEISSALTAAAALREKPSTLLNISLYEQRLRRSYSQLHNELHNLQFRRKWDAGQRQI